MRASYDPVLRQMTLPADATLYDRYHEMAHDVQRRIQCFPFRVWWRFNGIRVLGYLATVYVEFDAMRRARQALEWDGDWTEDTRKEGWTKLRSHITRKEL